MPSSTIQQSNIFGETTTTSSSSITEPVSHETTAAGRLIDHLKFIADQSIEFAANRANWLAIAANAGQNTAAGSLVKGELLKPNALTRAGALSGWTLPAIAATPLNLPTIPDNLKVDFAKLKIDAAADVTALQGSWMARYLPEVTDVTALQGLVNNVLNGTQDAAAQVRLDALAALTVANLKAITDATLASLNSAIATSRTNLAGNYASASASIGTASTTAQDNTNNIAWTRSRDQAAREGLRAENEAASAFASKGFSLPPGALAAQGAKARQATLAAANEMAAVQAEKTHQMFFELARAQIDAWLRLMDAQNSNEIQSFRAAMDLSLRTAELTLDANKFNARQAFEHLQLRLDFTKFGAELASKYRLGVIEGMNGLIRAFAALRTNELEYLNGIARAERDAQSAIIDYYRAAIAAAEVGMRLDITNNETDLKWATIAAQFIGTAVGHHVSAAGAAAEVFSRTAGMALSGLNGIASVATSA